MSAVVSDATHSVLGKAREVSQSSLGAFLNAESARRLPPTDYGATHVREVEVKSALTLCAMPGQPWSLNPYMGCAHDCVYCYVPDVAHVEREKWGRYVVVKRNLPTVLSHELKRKPRREVFMSSATDPYQPVERHQQVTRRCVELLAREDWTLRVLSRNPLMRRDIDLFHRFSDIEVGMSVPTLDDAMRRVVEPGAPNIQGRLNALRDLADAGITTFANIAPAYPLSEESRPRDMARAFAEARVDRVYAGAWRYLGSVLPMLEKRLPEGRQDAFARAVVDPAYYARLFRQLRAAFKAEGVPFFVMGERPGLQA